MGSFFPKTGRRAQPPCFHPLFGMALFVVLLASMLMIEPAAHASKAPAPSSGFTSYKNGTPIAVPEVFSQMMALRALHLQNWFGLGPCYGEIFELASMDYLESPVFMDSAATYTSKYWIGNKNRGLPWGLHPVLQAQFLWRKPNPWIYQIIKGRPYGHFHHEYIALAIRPDNRYLLGYFNFLDSRWYAFEGEEKFFPNPISLGFTSDYPSLVDGGWWGLEDLTIGKTAAEDAVGELFWSGNGRGARDLVVFKEELAKMIFMFIEGHRFYPIRDFVALHWNDAQPVTIPRYLAALTQHWKYISCALMYWHRTGDWSSGADAKYLATSEIELHTVDEALATVYPILNCKRCKQYA